VAAIVFSASFRRVPSTATAVWLRLCESIPMTIISSVAS
jgi:hypothetical protein